MGYSLLHGKVLGYLLTQVLVVCVRCQRCSLGSCCCPGGGLWPGVDEAGYCFHQQNAGGIHLLVKEG